MTFSLVELREPKFLSYFWSRVELSDPSGCWLWRGPSGGNDGRPFANWHGHTFYAYRASYAIAYGVEPGGLLVCHRCDVPKCVRPSHLFLGTQADNNRDMWQKGRARLSPLRGEAHPGVVVLDARVAVAREMYSTGEFTQAELAAQFGVAQSTIGRWTRGAVRENASGPRVRVGKGRNQTRQFPGVDRSRPCSEPDCSEIARTKGLCRLHYMRAWKAARRLVAS